MKAYQALERGTSRTQMNNTYDWLNAKQYEALQKLYHEFHEAFNALPDYIKAAYFARLYA